MTEFDPTTIPLGTTYDTKGNPLTFRDSKGFWWECTRDADGRQLTYRNSDGYWCEHTRDAKGNLLTFRSSTGVEI